MFENKLTIEGNKYLKPCGTHTAIQVFI